MEQVIIVQYSLPFFYRNANERGVVVRIRDALQRHLSLPDNAVLEYKLHNDCLK